MTVKSERRFRFGPFVLAVLAAPASSFLMWAVWDMTANGMGPLDIAGRLFGGVLFLVLVTGWGLIPCAAFGALFLMPLARLWPGPPPMAVLVAAGLAAAGAYVAVSLSMMEMPGVMLFAPWVAGRLGTEDMTGHPLLPIAVSIVLSGAVGAIVYAGAGGIPRGKASRSNSGS